MADNTTLNSGSGGDLIRTDEAIDRSTGVAISVKTQVVKLATGSAGIDGGVVTNENPIYVYDRRVAVLLERLCDQIDVLTELIRRV